MAHLWFLLPWPLIFELSKFPQRIYHDVKEVEHPLPLNTFPGEVFLVAVESAKMWSKPEGTTGDTPGWVCESQLVSKLVYDSPIYGTFSQATYTEGEIIHLHPVPRIGHPIPPPLARSLKWFWHISSSKSVPSVRSSEQKIWSVNEEALRIQVSPKEGISPYNPILGMGLEPSILF